MQQTVFACTITTLTLHFVFVRGLINVEIHLQEITVNNRFFVGCGEMTKYLYII